MADANVPAGTPAYGGFWIRFLAYIVDGLIVGIAFFLIVMLLAVMGLELISPTVIYFALLLLYWALMQSSARQATYGKSLVGLKVTGYAGERISFPRALGREVAKILSTLTLLIGFVIAAFTRRKQALHDFVASTYVVRVAPGHVVAAAAVAVVAFFAPLIVVMLFGAGLVATMMGGMAGAMMGGMMPEVTMEAPKPAPKPPAPQIAKPQPPAAAPPVLQTTAPAPMAQAAEPAKPATAKEPAKPMAKEPAKAAAAPRKPRAPKPAPATAPAPAAQPPAAPPTVVALRFNDLMTAVLYRDPGAVNDLLAFGKWPDKPDSRGMTPLMVAALLGEAASAEALLKAGADANRSGPGGDTAASIAHERRDAAMLGLLARYGARGATSPRP